MSTRKILVLDANQRSALAAVRSLGQAGHVAFTADTNQTALAASSRFSKNYYELPDFSINSQATLQSIREIARKNEIDFVLPVTDRTIGFLLRNRETLGSLLDLLPDASDYFSASDKCSLMRSADSLGIATPNIMTMPPGADIGEVKDKLSWPVVVKPCESQAIIDSTVVATSVDYADDYDQLLNLVRSRPWLKSSSYMLQRKVTGAGIGVFMLYYRGRKLAHFAHERIREKPPTGGVSVLCRSTDPDPLALKWATMLLDSLNWHGVAMVEFKRDDSGVPQLMEINARFWGSLQLALDAGVDFPRLLVEQEHADEQTAHCYKTGKKLRWLLGDLDSLYISLKTGSEIMPMALKLKAVIAFFVTFLDGSRLQVFRWSDPRPFFYEIRHYFRAGDRP